MIEDAAHSVRPVTVLLRVLGVAAGVLVSGCAHESADRQFAQMRDEIARIQADHDRFDNRLSVLEVRSASPLPASSGSPPARAEARVVHIDPESQEPQSIDDAADGGVRSIVLRGTGESHKKARGVESYPEGSAESDPSRPTALDANARKAYDDALHLVRGAVRKIDVDDDVARHAVVEHLANDLRSEFSGGRPMRISPRLDADLLAERERRNAEDRALGGARDGA